MKRWMRALLARYRNELSPAKSPLKAARNRRKRARKDPLMEEWIRYWEEDKKP